MVAIGVGAIAAGVGTAYGTGVAVALSVATALAAYVDQAYVYPSLFGKKDTKPDSLEGFQISTTDPGAPRWIVFGTRAWVPGHYMWTLNIDSETTGGGTSGGKGGAARPFVHTVRADVGLAVCDGPIAQINTLYADERPFWAFEFNRAVIEDHRWRILNTNTGRITIFNDNRDGQDFTSVFAVNDLVRLENITLPNDPTPNRIQGFYKCVAVTAATGNDPAKIILETVENHNLTGVGTTLPALAVDGGTVFSPGTLRRIDQGGASTGWRNGANDANTIKLLFFSQTNAEWISDFNRLWGDQDIVKQRWVVNGLYRFRNLPGNPNDTDWKLTAVFITYGGGGGYARLDFERQNGAPFPAGLPTAGVPAPLTTFPDYLIIHRSDIGSFNFIDSLQSIVEYPGSQTQGVDPTYAASEPQASAHRGIAHVSLTQWNLGPHSNIFPRVTAMVKSALGESIGTGIKRMCNLTVDQEYTDTSALRDQPLVGYSMPSGMPVNQALQPILTFYGVSVQDRGGVQTFIDERDLPVVSVATRHLNAQPHNSERQSFGFDAKRIDQADTPERLLLKYIDPQEGANEVEGVGDRAPLDKERGSRDTLEVDLQSLTAWPFMVKQRAREIFRRLKLESYTGQTVLPPGYLDTLPGHVLTFRSNNWKIEGISNVTILSHATELRDILPDSMAMAIRFSDGSQTTLFDDGKGKWSGFPTSVETAGITTNSIDYTNGVINIECGGGITIDDSTEILLSYRYEKQWYMRAHRSSFNSFDFTTEVSLITTITDEPMPPVPRDIPGIGAPVTGPAAPLYASEILDLPPLALSVGDQMLIGITARAQAGANWNGAVVYKSPNGVDRWTTAGTIPFESAMGVLLSHDLPASGDSTSVDWASTITVEMESGSLENATFEEIEDGKNWAVLGDEIIGFHNATVIGDENYYQLTGIVRGLRATDGVVQMDGHIAGERFVVLTDIGSAHGLYYEPFGGYSTSPKTYYHRVVASNGTVDDVETITTEIQGYSAVPAPPILDDSLITVTAGTGIGVEWARRSLAQESLFGPTALGGAWEAYEVSAYDPIAVTSPVGTQAHEDELEAAVRATWTVGDQDHITSTIKRSIDYANADIATDFGAGFVLGTSQVGFFVRQLNNSGKSRRSRAVVVTPS